MFGVTKLYEVYVKKDSARPLENAIFVSQGFNIWTFIFNFFWAVFNKLWLLAILFVALSLSEQIFHELYSQESAMMFSFTVLVLNIWIAFEAHNIKANSLKKKGYVLYDIVSGRNETDAEKRFFDKYVFFEEANNNVIA